MKPCRMFYLQYNQRQIFEYSRGRFLRNYVIWYSSPFMSAMSQNEESRVLSPSALAKVRLQPGSFDFIKSESTQMASHRHTNNHTHTHMSSPFNTGDNPRHTHARARPAGECYLSLLVRPHSSLIHCLGSNVS